MKSNSQDVYHHKNANCNQDLERCGTNEVASLAESRRFHMFRKTHEVEERECRGNKKKRMHKETKLAKGRGRHAVDLMDWRTSSAGDRSHVTVVFGAALGTADRGKL